MDYESWMFFFEELSYRKRMTVDEIKVKLLAAGKPAPAQISVKSGSQIFRVYQPPSPPASAYSRNVVR